MPDPDLCIEMVFAMTYFEIILNRAFMLAALESVDYVVTFAQDTPARLIAMVAPDVLVKGGDWSPDAIVGREVVEARGGRVVRVPLAKGHSTTRIASRVRGKR